MSKDILEGLEARKKLLQGMDTLANAVGSTLGPLGRNVAIDEYPNVDLPPTVYHDGVSVAKAINLKDNYEDMGARLLKAAALKTNEKAGDGTTTSTVIAQAIVREMMALIEAKHNPMVLKAEIEAAAKVAQSQLQKLVKKASTDQEIEQVASISSADPVIGRLVAEAVSKVGKDGSVTVEEGKSLETTVEYKDGMEIDRGFISNYFKTNEQEEAVIEEPYILMTDLKINYHRQLAPFLEKFLKETGSKNLVILAAEVVEEALATLVVNKLRGSLNSVAIIAPAFGDRRIQELDDLAAFVGGKPVLADEGRTLDKVDISELGRAAKVVATAEKTVIVDGWGKPGAVKTRMDDIREQIKVASSPFDKQVKEERLAKLGGAVAVINVGASTEVEMKEKKERVIDAVNATKAAAEEGVVAGGEIALLTISGGSQPEFKTTGGKIFKEALKAPFKKLVENAGLDYAEVWGKINGKPYPEGIDVTDGKVKNLIEAGIIDPVKVTRFALENAVSVAVMACTTNTLVTFAKEEKVD